MMGEGIHWNGILNISLDCLRELDNMYRIGKKKTTAPEDTIRKIGIFERAATIRCLVVEENGIILVLGVT
jgi:hypothetical protein